MSHWKIDELMARGYSYQEAQDYLDKQRKKTDDIFNEIKSFIKDTSHRLDDKEALKVLDKKLADIRSR